MRRFGRIAGGSLMIKLKDLAGRLEWPRELRSQGPVNVVQIHIIDVAYVDVCITIYITVGLLSTDWQ